MKFSVDVELPEDDAAWEGILAPLKIVLQSYNARLSALENPSARKETMPTTAKSIYQDIKKLCDKGLAIPDAPAATFPPALRAKMARVAELVTALKDGYVDQARESIASKDEGRIDATLRGLTDRFNDLNAITADWQAGATIGDTNVPVDFTH